MTTIFKATRFAKFDMGKHDGSAFVERLRVRALPTFRLYRGGHLVEQVTGARKVDLMQALVTQNRAVLAATA